MLRFLSQDDEISVHLTHTVSVPGYNPCLTPDTGYDPSFCPLLNPVSPANRVVP